MLGLAGWLVIGWMKRRIDLVGSRRNSQAPQRGTVQPVAVPTPRRLRYTEKALKAAWHTHNKMKTFISYNYYVGIFQN